MEMTVPQAVQAAYLPHPLTTAGRQVLAVPAKRNETLGGYLQRLGIEVDKAPHAIFVNDQPQGDGWRRCRLKRGDQIVVRAVVRGGGGGGNKVMRTVAMVAVMVAAYYTGGAATAAYGAGWGAAAQAGVMIGGSMLVNSLLPPPVATTAGIGSTSAESQSPTYALTGARNGLRQFEPMPVVIGRHRIVPDLAGKPFTRFEGQDQYLYQSFHFGLQSGLVLSDYQIGDTPLADYSDYQLFEAAEDGVLPVDFGNVDSETGRELLNSDGWISRTTSADCIGIGLDMQGMAYYANDDGSVSSLSLAYEAQLRAVGDVTWLDFGAGNFTLAGNKVNLVRQSLYQAVSRGQYEVRIRKTSPDVDSSRQKKQLALAQLRSHQYDGADYRSQRRVGLRIKASSQLNGALDNVSAIAQLAIPVWTGVAWENQFTTNPGWWLLWWLRGQFLDGRRLFGGGLADARIDIESIKQFATWCDVKQLSCSLVLDRKLSVKEVAELIARCGRGQLTWQTGRYGVIWDADDLPYVATFGPANIRAGSFKVSYASGKMADEVIVNFANRDKDWAADSVRKVVPGVTDPSNPVTLDFAGCDNADMAGREANLLAAQQLLLRRRVEWETDDEGLVATRGDVVMLSHDMVSWSESGRLVAGDRNRVMLDKAVALSAGGYVGIRFPDGRYATYRVQSGSGESATLLLRDAIPEGDDGGWLPVPAESPDLPACDWLWFYDPAAQPGKLVKITDVAPTGDGFRFTAVDYLADYYAAETGEFVYHASPPATLAVIGYLSLSETSRINKSGIRVPVLLASWPPVAGASQYRLRWRRTGGAWAEQLLDGTELSLDVDSGDYEVTVAAVFVGGGVSRAVAGSIAVLAAGEAPLVPLSFAATGQAMQIALSWQYPDQAAIAGVELYASIGGATKARLVALTYPVESWVHLGLSIGVTVDYELVLVDSWGNRSAAVTASAVTVKDPSLLLEQLQGGIGRDALDDLLATEMVTLDDLATRVLPQLNSLQEEAAESALQLLLQADARATEARFNRRAFSAIIDVDPATGQISLKATAEITTDVDAAIRDVQLLVDALNGQLTGTVTTINQHGTRLDAAETQLSLLQNQITLSVQQAFAYTDSVAYGSSTAVEDLSTVTGQLSEAQLRALLESDRQAGKTRAGKIGLASANLAIQANADAIAAEATARLALAAELSGTQSALVVEQQARASGDAAVSQQLTTLGATVSGNSAAITQEATARADAINGVLGKWSVKIITNAAGQQIVSGISLLNGNSGSAFAVLADQFTVALPSGASPKQVFTVGSLNGGAAVGVAGDLILDGAMSARHITADAANFVLLQAKSVWATAGYFSKLSEISANAGIVISGRLQNAATLAASSAVIDLDARGSQPFLQVINKTTGSTDVLVTADGYVQVARQVVSEPDVRASGTLAVDSGWLSPGSSWERVIDTGVSTDTAWTVAASAMHIGDATIASGQSQYGGGTGLRKVEVLIGDGLSTGSSGYVDNRIYLKFNYTHSGGGDIRITSLNWKLARV